MLIQLKDQAMVLSHIFYKMGYKHFSSFVKNSSDNEVIIKACALVAERKAIKIGLVNILDEMEFIDLNKIWKKEGGNKNAVL